ncbi:MAG: hypothetical protein GX162_07925 [Firmicutes bacterium]|nr:hypothetical protein [Bacillota bacterium]
MLKQGKVAVYRRYPSTIILEYAVVDPPEAHLRLKIDPGRRTTGLVIVNDKTKAVAFAAQLNHRGRIVKQNRRRAVRRSRRNRKG